ncbi:MAG: hypothetical protein V1929_03430 [bacterium]
MAELRVTARMTNEVSPAVKRMETEFDSLSVTATRGAKGMDAGYSRLGGSLLNVRAILSQLSVAYLAFAAIRSFRQMAMEAEDVSREVKALQDNWHEIMAGIAQESARFWLPAVSWVSKYIEYGFGFIRSGFQSIWIGILKTVQGGLAVLSASAQGPLANPLIKASGILDGISGIQESLTKEIKRTTDARWAEFSAIDEIGKKYATMGTGVRGTSKSPMKEQRKDVEALIADLERLAVATVEQQSKMEIGAPDFKARAQIINDYMAKGQQTLTSLKKMGIDGIKIWDMMVSKLWEARDATAAAKAEAEKPAKGFWQTASRGELLAWIKSMEDLKGKTDKVIDKFRGLKNAAADALQTIASSMANTVITVFDDWIEESLKPAREYLKQLAREMANWAIQTAFKVAANVAITAAGLAGGGVMHGGLQGIPSAAGGAVVRGPKLMILGDNASREEAAVPMRDGKIPIEGGTGRTVNVTMNVRAFDSRSFAQEILARRGDFQRMQARLAAEYGEY